MMTHVRWLGWVLALLATAACSGLNLPQSEFLPMLERKSGLIAYLGADGNVYVVDQGGLQPQAITADARAGSEYFIYGVPTWTRDGRQMAFAGYGGESGTGPSDFRLFTAPADGTRLTEIYQSADTVIYYHWSPDNQSLGLLAGTPRDTLAFKRVPVEGGATELLDAGQPFYWSWTPDGRMAIVHAGTGVAGRLSALDLQAGIAEHPIEITPASFRAPSLAPDGDRLLVAGRGPAGQSVLLLTDLRGGEPRQLAEYEGDIAFVWSPDGARVAYIAGQTASSPVTVIDPAGRAQAVTTEDDAYAFFWSPDGRSLAYFTVEEVPPAEGADPGADPQYTMVLKVLEIDGNSRRLTAFSPTERFLEMFPFFDQYHQSLTIWSPDSRNIVIAAYAQTDEPGIFVVPASGNFEPRFIDAGYMAVWSWK